MSTESSNNKGKGGDNGPKKPNKNKAVTITIIALLLVLIVIGVILIFIMLREKEPERLEARDILGGRGFVATEENYETLFEEFERPTDDAQFLVNMSIRLHFDTWDQSARSTYIKNDAGNIRTIYFDLFLNDENGNRGELIFESPYIPVGQELRNFSLNREIPAGEYSATIVYHLVDDEYEDITDLLLGVKLIIKE